MKKNLVIGSLLISTILTAVAPAMAAKIVIGGRGGIRVELGDDRRGPPGPGHHGPGRRDDRRDDHRPRGGSDRTVAFGVSSRGEWVRLGLRRPVDLTSIEVRGLRGDVRAVTARVYPVRGPSYDVRARGSVIDLRGRFAVTDIDVWVESRWDRSDVEFTVYSDNERPSVYVRNR